MPTKQTKMKQTFPKVTQVKDTPFTVVEQKDQTVICTGQYGVMIFKNKKEAFKLIEEKNWELLTKLILVVLDKITNSKQQENENNN